MRIIPNLSYENKYLNKLVCGLDEVGRGSLAGPLVTAGVILPLNVSLPGINDSKQIPKSEHERLVRLIYDTAIEVRFDVTQPRTVDSLGINPAIKQSMMNVANSFTHKPDVLLIDGSPWQKLELDITQETVVKGDTKSLSIACASLVAKYLHDEIMRNLDRQYPEFGFANNTGYGTKQHLQALETVGYTPEHRMSYKPLNHNIYKPYKVVTS